MHFVVLWEVVVDVNTRCLVCFFSTILFFCTFRIFCRFDARFHSIVACVSVFSIRTLSLSGFCSVRVFFIYALIVLFSFFLLWFGGVLSFRFFCSHHDKQVILWISLPDWCNSQRKTKEESCAIQLLNMLLGLCFLSFPDSAENFERLFGSTGCLSHKENIPFLFSFELWLSSTLFVLHILFHWCFLCVLSLQFWSSLDCPCINSVRE